MTLSTPRFSNQSPQNHPHFIPITTKSPSFHSNITRLSNTPKDSATTLITPLPLHLQFYTIPFHHHHSPPQQPTNSISPTPTPPQSTNPILPNTPPRPNYRKFSVVLPVFCCPPPLNYNTLKKRKKTISRSSFSPPLSLPSQRTP